ncbi:MAG: Bug family tripartite tricarboxylate transporter substrate binding protein [Burkholderiales bacterium]
MSKLKLVGMKDVADPRKLIAMQTICTLALVGAISLAHSQPYPAKPIRIIVPSAPGVGTDLLARGAAQHLGAKLGQAVVVENRIGADGAIGMEACARAAPDGYTICSAASNVLSFNIVLKPDLPYNAKSFTTVIHMGYFDSSLMVNAALPIKTLAELLDYSRTPAGPFTWATFDSVGTGFLYMRWLQQNRSAGLLHVPYKAPPQMLQAVITGEANGGIYAIGQLGAQIKSGKVRVLAVTSEERHPLAPDVPTFAELGIKLPLRSWYGTVVPAGTPREIVARLNTELNAALNDAEWRAKFVTSAGIIPSGGTAEQFAAFLDRDREAFAGLIKSLGVKAP